MTYTLQEFIKKHEDAGYYWFSAGAKRFFSSRILAATWTPSYDGRGAWFVTSEQFRPSQGDPHPRRYSVRWADFQSAKVDTVGEFQAYRTARDAKRAIKESQNAMMREEVE